MAPFLPHLGVILGVILAWFLSIFDLFACFGLIIFVVGFCGVSYVFQLEKWSRLRRRRSRRPQEMHETLLMFALLVRSMYNLGGAGVVV